MTHLLMDSSAIVALLDKSDEGHRRCVRAMREVTQPLATCEAVITESCFLLDRVPGATEAILANVASRAFQIRFSLKDSIQSVQALMYKYRDMPMSLADACLIQMADELGTGNILTLDSDFEHYRWRKIKRFNLLIPLV